MNLDFYFHDVPVAALQWRGRWLAMESCRRYSKPAKMLRSLAALSEEQLRRARAAAYEVPGRLLKGLTELRSSGRGGSGRHCLGKTTHHRSSVRAAPRENKHR